MTPIKVITAIFINHGWRYTEVPVTVHYTPYAKAKGQRNSSGFSIVRDLVLRRWM